EASSKEKVPAAVAPTISSACPLLQPRTGRNLHGVAARTGRYFGDRRADDAEAGRGGAAHAAGPYDGRGGQGQRTGLPARAGRLPGPSRGARRAVGAEEAAGPPGVRQAAAAARRGRRTARRGAARPGGT